MLLADLGADVIKVEPPRGDAGRNAGVGLSRDAIFCAYNRGKRSVAIDLGRPEGVAVARALALSADVVVQSARPGALEGMGLGADQLRADRPELIHATVTGFPGQGPSAQRRGLDIAAQAESGLMSINGDAGGDPLRVGFAVVDSATTLALANGILAALLRRQANGEGETITISLYEVGIYLQAQAWSVYSLTGETPRPTGNSQPFVAPGSDVFATADGHITLSAYLEHHWKLLCTTLGVPELVTDVRFANNDARVRNRNAMRDALAPRLAAFTSDEVTTMLARAGIVVGDIRTYPKVESHRDTTDSGIMVLHRRREGHPVIGIASPYQRASSPRPREYTLPGVGEHTETVLKEIGLSADQIDELRRGRIVTSENSAPPAPTRALEAEL
jgi:crotonobetainyl-CoA:carnitine CoA-transferase CaiB-like acyl-CoA transferase